MVAAEGGDHVRVACIQFPRMSSVSFINVIPFSRAATAPLMYVTDCEKKIIHDSDTTSLGLAGQTMDDPKHKNHHRYFVRYTVVGIPAKPN